MSTHSLSRRAVLQASGLGALALTLPLATVAPAGAAAPTPEALRRATYVGLIGASFDVEDGPTLTLRAVGDVAGAKQDPSLAGHDEAFVLSFVGPAAPALDSSIHTITHPFIGAVGLFISPVDAPAGDAHYEVVVDRTVKLGSAFDLAPTPAAAAESSLARSSDPAALSKAASAATIPGAMRLARHRLRVTASAKRVGRHVTASLHFPASGIKAVEVRLVRGGKTYATGSAVVRQHRATVTLNGARAVAHGKYELVLTATDRQLLPKTVARSVTIR